jgi:quercetin dioxygenase-like cupin family protein
MLSFFSEFGNLFCFRSSVTCWVQGCFCWCDIFIFLMGCLKHVEFDGVCGVRVFHFDSVLAADAGEDSFKVRVRWLIDDGLSAENFFMRLFEIESGGYTPFHGHDWEHEVFVLEGDGMVMGEEEAKLFMAGDVVYIPAKEKHQFRNTGKKLARILCLIPNKKDSNKASTCQCK